MFKSNLRGLDRDSTKIWKNLPASYPLAKIWYRWKSMREYYGSKHNTNWICWFQVKILVDYLINIQWFSIFCWNNKHLNFLIQYDRMSQFHPDSVWVKVEKVVYWQWVWRLRKYRKYDCFLFWGRKRRKNFNKSEATDTSKALHFEITKQRSQYLELFR